MEKNKKDILQELETGDYKYGFVSDIETETIGTGLNEDELKLVLGDNAQKLIFE